MSASIPSDRVTALMDQMQDVADDGAFANRHWWSRRYSDVYSALRELVTEARAEERGRVKQRAEEQA